MATIRWATIVWLALYVATMVALFGTLITARRQVIGELDNPRARAEWQAWKADVARARPGPVQRRVPHGDEPPALVIMRDNFAGVVVTSMVISTCLFGFVMLALRGAFGTRARHVPPDARAESARSQ